MPSFFSTRATHSRKNEPVEPFADVGNDDVSDKAWNVFNSVIGQQRLLHTGNLNAESLD